jgi:hypothetical protein
MAVLSLPGSKAMLAWMSAAVGIEVAIMLAQYLRSAVSQVLPLSGAMEQQCLVAGMDDDTETS